MFYWKYQDIPEDEIAMLQEKYRKILPNNFEFFQVVPLDIKTFMGLKISRAVLIQVEPNAKGRIRYLSKRVPPSPTC